MVMEIGSAELLGKFLRNWREDNDSVGKQDQIAKRAKMSQPQISRYERGMIGL